MTRVKYRHWGEQIDPAAHKQMRNACDLPVAAAGALMPDAHVGYGLPIGGVLGTKDAVIPYAVGVDIACRVKITVFDRPAEALTNATQELVRIINQNTRFGVGAKWQKRHAHEVLDDDWSGPLLSGLKDTASEQLGTSGSGNHFVEFGELEVSGPGPDRELGLEHARKYLALVSHSGSRGPGARVADYYSKLARTLHPDLPKALAHLAWLPLTEEGADYWHAMELMGKFASANHQIIHQLIQKALGAEGIVSIENHHNYAWKEVHDGEELIVHRKGATPAGAGVLGYIPGSMIAPGFIVAGRGERSSLESASHGAGRQLSRKQAKETMTNSQLNRMLGEHGVKLISAGLDEAPHAYKDINSVMQAQSDLVQIRARFTPKIVKMAGAGERPED